MNSVHGDPTQVISCVGSPTVAAWVAAGTPVPAIASPQAGQQWCASCGNRSIPLSPAHTVVSRKFTAADTWAYGGHMLCAACAWSYTTARLRRSVYRIDQHPPSLVDVDRATLGKRLASTPLPTASAVVIPVRGRRHILPTAQWGHVCTDDTQLRWDDDAVTLMRTLRRLRTRIRARALHESVPPLAALRATASTTEHRDLWRDWQSLDPWRARNDSWWDAAIALSTPDAQPTT